MLNSSRKKFGQNRRLKKTPKWFCLRTMYGIHNVISGTIFIPLACHRKCSSHIPFLKGFFIVISPYFRGRTNIDIFWCITEWIDDERTSFGSIVQKKQIFLEETGDRKGTDVTFLVSPLPRKLYHNGTSTGMGQALCGIYNKWIKCQQKYMHNVLL